MWIAINYLSYSTVCYTIFGAIPCSELGDGIRVLDADRSISCDSPTYQVHVALAISGIAGFVIGMPAAFLISLRRSKREGRLDGNDAFHPFLFLTGAYRSETYWFDPATFAMKATIGGMFVFMEKSLLKFLYGIIVAAFWFGVGAAH